MSSAAITAMNKRNSLTLADLNRVHTPEFMKTPSPAHSRNTSPSTSRNVSPSPSPRPLLNAPTADATKPTALSVDGSKSGFFSIASRRRSSDMSSTTDASYVPTVTSDTRDRDDMSSTTTATPRGSMVTSPSAVLSKLLSFGGKGEKDGERSPGSNGNNKESVWKRSVRRFSWDSDADTTDESTATTITVTGAGATAAANKPPRPSPSPSSREVHDMQRKLKHLAEQLRRTDEEREDMMVALQSMMLEREQAEDEKLGLETQVSRMERQVFDKSQETHMLGEQLEQMKLRVDEVMAHQSKKWWKIGSDGESLRSRRLSKRLTTARETQLCHYKDQLSLNEYEIREILTELNKLLAENDHMKRQLVQSQQEIQRSSKRLNIVVTEKEQLETSLSLLEDDLVVHEEGTKEQNSCYKQMMETVLAEKREISIQLHQANHKIFELQRDKDKLQRSLHSFKNNVDTRFNKALMDQVDYNQKVSNALNDKAKAERESAELRHHLKSTTLKMKQAIQDKDMSEKILKKAQERIAQLKEQIADNVGGIPDIDTAGLSPVSKLTNQEVVDQLMVEYPAVRHMSKELEEAKVEIASLGRFTEDLKRDKDLLLQKVQAMRVSPLYHDPTRPKSGRLSASSVTGATGLADAVAKLNEPGATVDSVLMDMSENSPPKASPREMALKQTGSPKTGRSHSLQSLGNSDHCNMDPAEYCKLAQAEIERLNTECADLHRIKTCYEEELMQQANTMSERQEQWSEMQNQYEKSIATLQTASDMSASERTENDIDIDDLEHDEST
eukprot:GFYU01003344.1.p1 GENE.GFYU01003344.1~~GFYU01003344.1.p1  ORF type:complete len:786 (-),score=237.96 GFYU01003344.1:72-2429(-)